VNRPAQLPPPLPGRAEAAIGRVLQAGTALAAALVLGGGVLFLARHGHEAPAWDVFRGVPAEWRSPGGIVAAALAGSGRALVQLGVLALVATPVARVALSVGAFALARDRRFVAVGLVVLATLLAGLAGWTPHGPAPAPDAPRTTQPPPTQTTQTGPR
jgi:uncharacterized membrane protein